VRHANTAPLPPRRRSIRSPERTAKSSAEARSAYSPFP
jgi:hypothetical protein